MCGLLYTGLLILGSDHAACMPCLQRLRNWKIISTVDAHCACAVTSPLAASVPGNTSSLTQPTNTQTESAVSALCDVLHNSRSAHCMQQQAPAVKACMFAQHNAMFHWHASRSAGGACGLCTGGAHRADGRWLPAGHLPAASCQRRGALQHVQGTKKTVGHVI